MPLYRIKTSPSGVPAAGNFFVDASTKLLPGKDEDGKQYVIEMTAAEAAPLVERNDGLLEKYHPKKGEECHVVEKGNRAPDPALLETAGHAANMEKQQAEAEAAAKEAEAAIAAKDAEIEALKAQLKAATDDSGKA